MAININASNANKKFYAMVGLWTIGTAVPWPYGLPALGAASILTVLVRRDYDQIIAELKIKGTRDDTGRVIVSLPGAPLNEDDMRVFEATFCEAIDSDSRVGFDYQDRDGNISAREITPYYIQNMSNGLGVAGHCYKRDAERNFYIDRMSNVRITQHGTKKVNSDSVFGSSNSSSLDDIPF